MAGKIKGHTVIELTDVNTGEKEYYEHNNMITNAVEGFFNTWLPLMGWGFFREFLMPLYEQMYGGIYLFDNTLTENVNNMFLPDPASAKLTGYAGHFVSDGLDKQRGDFNFSESGAITNGYKFVWDFGTDDANGEIASVGLTNSFAGYHGYHYSPLQIFFGNNVGTGNIATNYKAMNVYYRYYASNTSYQDQWDRYILPLPNLNGNAAFFTNVEQTEGKILFTAVKETSATNMQRIIYEINTNNLDIENKNYGIFTQKSVENVTVSDTQYHVDMLFLDDGNSRYYGVESSGGNYLVYRVVDRETMQIVTATEVIDVYQQIGKYVIPVGANGSGQKGAVYRNGYIYFFVSDTNVSRYDGASGYVARLNVLDKTVEVITPKFTSNDKNNYNYMFMYKGNNGEINTSGYIIATDDTITEAVSGHYVTSYGANPTCLVDKFIISWYGGTYYTSQNAILLPNLQYLATINNLDTPVTKTAAKTMKITYTLTYAD